MPPHRLRTGAARVFYRRRRWAWSGVGVLGLVLLALLAVYWLLQTVAGRDVLLAQVVARLPVGASFTWDKVDGPVAGPLTLYNVDFRYDDIHFHAERAYLEPDLRPLLGRKLLLDKLELSNATLNLAKSDEPFELPSWPDSLPQIEMPLAIQADAIAIDGFRISQANEPVIDISRVRGGIEIANGEFQARRLVVDSDMGNFTAQGRYIPAKDYDTDVTFTAVLPAPRGRTVATVGLVARGDLSHMEVAVAGARRSRCTRCWCSMAAPTRPGTPACAATSWIWRCCRQHWRARRSRRCAGKGGNANLRGKVKQGDQELELAPSVVSLQDQVLKVSPLLVKGLGGEARLEGTADFSQEDQQKLNFSVVARDLTWVPAPDPNTAGSAPVPVTLKEARFGLAGTLKAWAAIGRADVEREKQKAQLRFDVRGNDQAASIHQLQAQTPGGQLQVEGQVAVAPQLDWDAKATLKDSTPATSCRLERPPVRQPGLKGRQPPPPANAAPGTSGTLEATVDLPSLKGILRQRNLDAQGKFALQGAQGQGDLKLSLGSSRVTASGKVGDRLDIEARFEPLQLSDLLPAADGGLRGQVQVKGPRDAPDITADLVGNNLNWDGYGAESLSIRAPAVARRQRHAGRAGPAGQRGHAAGAAEHRRTGQCVQPAPGRADPQRDGCGRAAGQRAPAGHAVAWRAGLAAHRTGEGRCLGAACTGGVRDQRQHLHLSEACLAPPAAARAHRPTGRAKAWWCSDALPLALVQPWAPPQSGRRIYLRGDVSLDAQIRPRGAAWEGHVEVRSKEGGVRLGENRNTVGDTTRGELVRYDQFSLKLDMTPSSIKGYLGMGFQGNGFVDAKMQTGWEASAPLNGELYLNMSRLYWLELFSPDIVRPTGLIEGHVSLRGTRGQPSLGGDAQLSNFKGEFPALGLTFDQGKGSFVAQPDGSAKITAQANSGQGTLYVDGGLSWFGDAQPLQLKIHGENVLLSNTSELRIVANPNLDFTLAKAAMELRGTVHVPEADIDLERLDRGTSVSEDVVVLDPADPEESRTSPLDMDLTVSLGEKVKMTGFGLKGALTGKMQVWAKPGREMTANGAWK